MTEVIFRLLDGSQRKVDAQDGATILETAKSSNIEGIIAECGGSCSCATCHVYVDEAHYMSFDPPGAFEEDLLEGVAAERSPHSRLSCQLRVSPRVAGAIFTIPPAQI